MLNCETLFSVAIPESISWEDDNANVLKIAVNFDAGNIVGLANLNPYGQNCVALKDTGSMQIWSLRHNQIVARLNIGEKVNHTHPQFIQKICF